MNARPRGRPSLDVDDRTPLNGPQVDVGPRIGWVLRISRLLNADAASIGLQGMAALVGSNATRLHRLETGTVREGRLAERYEDVLGLTPASLRAPIDVTCRTFPEAPADKSPAFRTATVAELSSLTERLLSPQTQHASQWLTWARILAQPGAIGLPEFLAYDLVVRLISELNRSTSHAYATRYEALALLRCSDYGHLVLDAAREQIADPDIQVLNDMMSAVGERVSRDAVEWCLELLEDPRERVVHGAALALENMGQISDSPEKFWAASVDRIIALHNAAAGDAPGWVWHSHLLRLMPESVVAPRRTRVSQPLAPAPVIVNWEREEANAHWSDVRRYAADISSDLGLDYQPMLARLIFDVAMSPYETRAVTSYMLLGAIPRLNDQVTACLGRLNDSNDDPNLRRRILRRLPGMSLGRFPPMGSSWLVDGDDDELEAALLLAGAAGIHVPVEVLAHAVRRSDTLASRAMYSAGMSAHPALTDFLNDPACPPQVAAAAGWWLRHGARLQE
ncbi:hypothetical protein BH09ACT12_BH09ACT12_25920 [soil metagenome]